MRLAARLGLLFLVATFALAAAVAAAAGPVGVLVTLLLVTLLVLRETVARAAPESLRLRLGLFLFVGLLAFLYVVVQRVREVLRL